MNWLYLGGAILTGLIITGIGVGGVWWFYLRTRTKKITYSANIWEATGEVSDIRDEKGNIIKQIPLKALQPYAKDMIEKVDLQHKITTYRLVGHNRVVPEVKAEHITYWGKDERVVNVLKDGDNFTLMRVGYDNLTGTKVFQPVPYDRANMMLNQYAVKEERFQKEKDILQAITPWVVAALLFLSIVASSYFLGQAWIETSVNHKEAAEDYRLGMQEITAQYIEIAKLIKNEGYSLEDAIQNKKDKELGPQEKG